MADLQFLHEEWTVISTRLDEALALPPAQHAAWLAALDEPPALKHKLQRLLAQAPGAETDDFAPALPRLTLGPKDSPLADGVEADAVIGPYRLIRELGVGGMGRGVAGRAPRWRAEAAGGPEAAAGELDPRPGPIAWRASATSWPGWTTRTSRRSSTPAWTKAAVPTLALEYVEGEAIDAHCRRLALPLPQRLQLILQVARAVAHAHARLVVHRDLKPANILVTPAGEVRLLDFGIAKLLEGEATQETELTVQGGRALTLDYASPEQVRGRTAGRGQRRVQPGRGGL